jgi:hypothetical protein
VRQTSSALMWPEKRHDDMARSTAPTTQAWPHVLEWEIIAEPSSQLHQGEPRRVLALAAVGAEIIAIVDVRERRSLELGEVHARSVAVLEGACIHSTSDVGLLDKLVHVEAVFSL